MPTVSATLKVVARFAVWLCGCVACVAKDEEKTKRQKDNHLKNSRVWASNAQTLWTCRQSSFLDQKVLMRSWRPQRHNGTTILQTRKKSLRAQPSSDRKVVPPSGRTLCRVVLSSCRRSKVASMTIDNRCSLPFLLSEPSRDLYRVGSVSKVLRPVCQYVSFLANVTHPWPI